MIEYTDEQAAADVISAMDSVAIVTAVRAIAEAIELTKKKVRYFVTKDTLL